MIVVGTTLAAFAMDQEDTWGAWLYEAEAMIANSEHDLVFFVAIQVDRRGLEPFEPLLKRLLEVADSGEGQLCSTRVAWWTYSLDDGRTEVTTDNRLRHLTMGQNLVSEYARAEGASHLLFMAADCQPDPKGLDRLVELDSGLVGGHVSTYNFQGPLQELHREGEDGWDHVQVMLHFPTAAYVLIRRDVFTRLRWRVDAELGMTDDPAYAHDAKTLLGVEPLIRMDVVVRHYPEAIGAIETRGHDRTVHRG